MGGGGSTNTIQNTTPWSAEQGPLEDIYSQASNNYNVEQAGGNLQYYPGQTYAPLTQPQQQLIGQAEGVGEAGGTPALQAGESALSSILSPSYTAGTSAPMTAGNSVLQNELSPGYLSPMDNPGEQNVIASTLASVNPQAEASFTNGNRSDSGLATSALTNASTNAIGNLLAGQYNTNLATQNQAQQSAANDYLTQQKNQVSSLLTTPSIDQATMGDISAGLQAGGQTQTDLQNQINAAMQQYNYGQMLPYNALSLYENAVTGTGSPGGTSQTSSPYFTNPVASALGAGTGALALGTAASNAGLFSGIGDYLAGAALASQGI